MTLGEKINKLRKSKSIAREGFAERMKVSKESVSMWELDIVYPEMGKLKLMANIFEVTLDELVK